MRRIDVNIRYRAAAIFCAVHGVKDGCRVLIPWEVLREKFGINWQSLTNELHVKGMLHSSNGYEYLRPSWIEMTPAERMAEVKKMYPYPYQKP